MNAVRKYRQNATRSQNDAKSFQTISSYARSHISLAWNVMVHLIIILKPIIRLKEDVMFGNDLQMYSRERKYLRNEM